MIWRPRRQAPIAKSVLRCGGAGTGTRAMIISSHSHEIQYQHWNIELAGPTAVSNCRDTHLGGNTLMARYCDARDVRSDVIFIFSPSLLKIDAMAE